MKLDLYFKALKERKIIVFCERSIRVLFWSLLLSWNLHFGEMDYDYWHSKLNTHVQVIGFTKVVVVFFSCVHSYGECSGYAMNFKSTNIICKQHDTCIWKYVVSLSANKILYWWHLVISTCRFFLLFVSWLALCAVYVSYCWATTTIPKCTVVWVGKLKEKEKERKELFIIYKWSLDANGMQNERGSK